MNKRMLFAFLLAAGPFSWIACQKKEEPAPTPAAEEPEEKPKKKKKKVEDEEPLPDVGGVAESPTGTGAGTGTWKPGTPVAKTDAGSATSDADKQKLIACCTALKNAATAAGIANQAASAAVPGMPAPPPKEELDKAAKECDKAVVNWNGDLNSSLKTVKGATAVALPSACMITGG